MKTIQQWTTELTERGITDFNVQAGEGVSGVAELSLTWSEPIPDHDGEAAVAIPCVERFRIDAYHFGVYLVADMGGKRWHFAYEFYGDFAAAASKLREETIQELIDQLNAASV